VALAAGATVTIDSAHAGCNAIPPASETFRGVLGSTDRPFARPGDWLRLALEPACHSQSAGFAGAASNLVVTVVHTPPAGGPRTVVALASDCDAVDTASCAALAEVESATCIAVNQPGEPIGLEKLDAGTLRFRFPDTDGLLGHVSDDLTLTGPVTLAVTALGNPLPCELASEPCAPRPGLLACVDALRADNGTCNAQPHPTFSHFTALPPPNDYRAVCTSPAPPCTGAVDDLRFTVDAAGNILIPMDWRGIRVDRDAVPVARLLRASSTVEAFEGRGAPIRMADLDSLGSYSPEGIKLPPLFDPQSDPTQMSTATFFGSTDAEETVLRFARHRQPSNQCLGGANDDLPCGGAGDCPGGVCAPPICAGGSNAGASCAVDPECPGSECGAGLFDFRTRLLAGRGPVLLRLGACIGGSNAQASCTADGDCPGGQCGAFTMTALDPVPLDGLNQSDAMSAFVLEEAIADPATDMNGDGDAIDSVIKLADRSTGAVQAIGPGVSQARALARVRQPPFSFPALAIDDDLVAFLEPEPRQGLNDANGNGQVFETLLRAYRLGGGALGNPAAPLVASAAPLLDGRSLAISDGFVLFRSPESGGATQTTTRVSVDSAGNQATGGMYGSLMPTLSADGRYVAFFSHATDLVPGDTNNVADVFVHDRTTGATWRVSVSHTGAEAMYGVSDYSPFISADGRYVAFSSTASNLVPDDTVACGGGWIGTCQDIFVHDRDFDGDGIFDETGPGERTTVLVSVASDGSHGNGRSRNDIGSISPDGRWVTFSSEATNLAAGDANGFEDVFIHDRDADQDGVFDETGAGERATVQISVGPDGLGGNGRSWSPTASADGRFVAFESEACNLIPGDCVTSGDTNGVGDIFLRDRDTDADGIYDEPGASATIRVSVDAAGAEANANSFEAMLSADGGTVVFASRAGNLVPGDNNSKTDIFAWDRITGRVTAISTTPSGRVSGGHSGSPKTTPDGRFVVFIAQTGDLVGGTPGSPFDSYLHDRLTGLTVRIHVDAAGGPADQQNHGSPALSADGSVVAFASFATDLVAGDSNGMPDVFVRAPAAGSGDLSGDGDAGDVLLRALDTSTGPPSAVIDLCPATSASVADGRAAFLRPEDAGPAPALAQCPTATLVGGRPDLNGDGDGDDSVVHLWNGSSIDNLALAADDVVLSDSWIAARASESDQGDTDLNGDGDRDDGVAHVQAIGSFVWTNLARAAEDLAIAHALVAFLTPEAQQGATDLNGDGDATDRVVHVHDAAASSTTNVGEAAEELVVGESGLVAFRTREASQGNQDLNQDGDSADAVLQVYDAVAELLLNSGQAVTPCRLEACDPRVPYRVRGDTVTFLTLEADQGEDLNHDGDLGDLVLQVLNVRQACNSGPASACRALAATSAGVCTDTGEACVDDDACPLGECFLPPGGCLRDLGTSCDPLNGAGCVGANHFCQPILGAPGSGTCMRDEGACRSDADCSAPAQCSQSSQGFQRLMDPLADHRGGTAVFTSSGRCTENVGTVCVVSDQCEAGEFCLQGSCRRQHGVCAGDGDCPTDSTCQPQLLRATADDADLDELPDVIDNCPGVPNIDQADLDGDGVGDACDLENCSNGVLEGEEECDDENLVSGDGCDENCRLTACGNGVVTAGEICDDGNSLSNDGCKSDCTPNVCGDGFARTGVEECDDGNGVDTDACKSDCSENVCGDGIRETGVEACDDGDADGGDGCSAACAIEPCWQCSGTPSTCSPDPNGTPCDDGDACTVDGTCNAGTCGNTPLTCDDGNPCTQDSCSPTTGCVFDPTPRPSCDPASSLLRIRHDPATPERDGLLWKWFRGNAPRSHFGSPTMTTDSTLCLYDQNGLVSALHVPAGGTCGDAPCWIETASGFRYRDAAAARDGVRIVVEKEAPNARVTLKGRGLPLPDIATAALTPPVTAQWVNDTTNACFGAVYGPGAVVKQDAILFKARQ